MPEAQIVASGINEVADAPASRPGTVAEAEHAAHHETVFGLDSYAIVGLAFLTFLLILWKAGAFHMVGGALDAQADKVKSDLAEAAQLKADAEALKARAAAEAADAREQARQTLEHAGIEAKRIIEQAALDAEEAIGRRTRIAEDRIAAEARATEAELRTRAADLAVQAAEALLGERAAELGPLTDKAIAGLGQR